MMNAAFTDMQFRRVANLGTANGLLEKPVQHQPLLLVIYMHAVNAPIHGQHFDILRYNALAEA